MPTPPEAFAEIAARYGGIDPCDTDAVQRWYTETLPALPPEQIEEILEELLEREGAGQGEAGRPCYPEDVSLPSLESSPPVPLPLLALGWRNFLRRLLLRRGPPADEGESPSRDG